MKISPAPWILIEAKTSTDAGGIFDANYRQLTEYFGYEEGDWHLVAAAPELLSLLQRIVAARAKYGSAMLEGDDWPAIEQDIAATIAKAAGE